jgi:hypothetical protein
MNLSTQRMLARIVLVAMVVLIVIGLLTRTYTVAIVGLVGAIPSFARFFASPGSSPATKGPAGGPDEAETIRGLEHSHSGRHNSPTAADTAPVTERLRRWRNSTTGGNS